MTKINLHGYSSIFIITGKNSYIKSGAKNFFANKFRNKKIKFFFKKKKNPDLSELKIIIKHVKKFNPDLIMAIGGGSVIDYGKLVNILVLEPQIYLKKILVKKNYKMFTKLWVFPTTAGSGAEATKFSVIYKNNKKYSLENKNLLPNKIFHIPLFAKNASYKIRASAALDAISQSLESFVSKCSNNKSLYFSKKSLSILLKHYKKYLIKPTLSNSSQMLKGSYLAGKAINISKTNGPHALSYYFNTNFKISHGHSVFLTTPEFFLFNFRNYHRSSTWFNLKKRYSYIFKIMKVNDINELYLNLIKIRNETNLEFDFKKLNIDLRRVKKNLFMNINPERLNNNPIKIKKHEVFQILER